MISVHKIQYPPDIHFSIQHDQAVGIAIKFPETFLNLLKRNILIVKMCTAKQMGSSLTFIKCFCHEAVCIFLDIG